MCAASFVRGRCGIPFEEYTVVAYRGEDDAREDDHCFDRHLLEVQVHHGDLPHSTPARPAQHVAPYDNMLQLSTSPMCHTETAPKLPTPALPLFHLFFSFVKHTGLAGACHATSLRDVGVVGLRDAEQRARVHRRQRLLHADDVTA